MVNDLTTYHFSYHVLKEEGESHVTEDPCVNGSMEFKPLDNLASGNPVPSKTSC